MALSKEHTYMGITLPDAYFKIDPAIILEYDHDQNILYISVYANTAARAENLVIETIRIVAPNIEVSAKEGDGDYRDRFYRWLKTLPEFQNTIDV